MYYELKKVLFDKKILVALVFFLFVNLFCIYKTCVQTQYSYDEYSNVEEDLSVYKEDIEYNISTSQNIELMKKIYSNVRDRVVGGVNRNSREKEYLEYNTYTIFLAFMMIMLSVRIIECERNNRMNSLMYTSKNCNRQIINKQLCILTYCFGGVVIFELVNFFGFITMGNVNVFKKMYAISGFTFTWFNGNILCYKLLYIIMLTLCMIFISELTFFCCHFIRGEVKNLFVSIVVCAGIFFWSKKMVLYTRVFNPFTVIDLNSIINNYEVVKINGKYYLLFGLVMIVTLIYCGTLMGLNIRKSIRGNAS